MAIFKRTRLAPGGLAALLASVAGPGLAQPAAADPAPNLPTKLQYTSPLASFQGYSDQSMQSWREANDQVGRIGGWKAYAKEAQAAQAGAGEGGASPSPAASDPHAGHHGGGKP